MNLHLSLLAFVAGGLAAQDALTLAEGATPATLTIRELDEQQIQAPGRVVLRDAELLPIEFTHRTHANAGRRDRPRLADRLGARRIELPGGGKVFRYRLQGGQRWGFLLVTARGAALPLLELAGTGATGTGDPFTDRIGIAPDGLHAALLAQDGRLWLARCDGSTFASTGTPARAIATSALPEPLSLTPGRTSLFFVTADDRVWRCALADHAQPQDVTPPSQPNARAKDEFALSGDGTAAVFLYGPRDPVDAQRLHLVRDAGPSLALPPPPGKYEEPGYLPEVSVGPRLLLNDDATRLLYVDSSSRDEWFLLDVGAATATTQITGDHNFQPYIGQGLLPGFRANTVLVAIGDPDRFDLYVATTGNAPVVNLTQTNGNTTRPFASGALVPRASLTLDGGVELVSEQSPAGLRLRAVDPLAARQAVLLDGLLAPPEHGTGTAPAVLVRTTAGDRQLEADGALRLVAPPGLALQREVGHPAFSMFRVVAGAQAAVLFRLPGGGLLALPPETGLQQAVLTGQGLVLDGATLRYFAPGVGATLAAGPVRQVLSGRDS
jgi:hypothetical protein